MLEFVKIIAIVLFSVIAHECAHGLTALWRGDTTARDAGRLTLNPLKHIDPVGTIIVPVVLRLMGFAPLGWARPVPVDFSRLKDPKRDMLLVGASGPLTNICIAFLFSLILKSFAWSWPARSFLTTALIVNLVLAVFNLIPIPPLDGSRVVASLLPDGLMRQYLRFERYGIIVVLVLLNLGLFRVIWLGVEVLAGMMGVKV
ncbi:MAG: site-2 protease family protein [Candidatus Omnitrophota bacterium]